MIKLDVNRILTRSVYEGVIAGMNMIAKAAEDKSDYYSSNTENVITTIAESVLLKLSEVLILDEDNDLDVTPETTTQEAK